MLRIIFVTTLNDCFFFYFISFFSSKPYVKVYFVIAPSFNEKAALSGSNKAQRCFELDFSLPC